MGIDDIGVIQMMDIGFCIVVVAIYYGTVCKDPQPLLLPEVWDRDSMANERQRGAHNTIIVHIVRVHLVVHV